MARLRRASTRLAVLALAWTGVVLCGGGFRFETAVFTISARGWRNPLIISLVAALVAWYAGPKGGRRSALIDDLAPLDRAAAATTRLAVRGWQARHSAARIASRWFPPTFTTFLAGLVVTVGVVRGSFIAGGSDSYGYVSQAHVWASGTLDVDSPLMRELRETIRVDAFVPLGWRPNLTRDGIVPAYAPGFPIVMSLFERVGGPDAVFYALPLFGGLAIWATYLLGRASGDPLVGAIAALLLATSPTFLYQLTAAPMSDVPTLAWWTLALALATMARPGLVAIGGLAAGAAVLTRPNLAPLAIVPAVLIASPLLVTRQLDRGAIARTVLFVAGVVPGAIAVAAINAYWYGSPTTSGYGAIENLFAREYWRTNVSHWTAWLSDTQTPLIAAAIGAPFMAGRLIKARASAFGPRTVAIASTLFVAAVIASYLFYFPYDAWWYLRFLLPGYGALFVCLAATLVAAARWRPNAITRVALVAVVALLAYHGVKRSYDWGVTEWMGDRKYAVVGWYVDRRLPARAVMVTMLQSGSLRLYSGRTTVRWDWIDETGLDDLVRLLRARGDEPYLVLESYEVETFRKRFQTSKYVDVLRHPPLAQLPDASTRIYAFDDVVPATRRVTETIRDE